MAKKIIKKAAPAAKATTKATKTAPAKKAAPKAVSANITACDELYSLIRENYNASNDKQITKDEVAKVMKSYAAVLGEFAKGSDADKATCVLPEIGTMTVFVAPEHDSINPKTGATCHVPAKKRVRFKAYPRFVTSINE